MEGMISFRAVVDGIRSGVNTRRIVKVIYDKERAPRIASHLRYIRAMSYELGFSVEESDADTVNRYAVGTSHGGILTFCTDRALPPLSKISKKDGFYVMLGGIEDPYNFGYALRSLYAAGVDGVILPPRNWMTAAGVVSRASAGAAEQMPLYLSDSDNETVAFFRENGYRIVCSALENSVSMKHADLRRPLLLAIGGEKRGLSKDVLAAADETVRIDYGREFKESLSAASAAAILAFAVLSKNSPD